MGLGHHLILLDPKRLDPKFRHCSLNGLEDIKVRNLVTLALVCWSCDRIEGVTKVAQD